MAGPEVCVNDVLFALKDTEGRLAKDGALVVSSCASRVPGRPPASLYSEAVTVPSAVFVQRSMRAFVNVPVVVGLNANALAR